MEHLFETREEASLAAAKHIIAALTGRLDGQSKASLVVTGGSSPKLCYAALARIELEWNRVQLLLSDERWVPPTHADSNERMLRETLLTNCATEADLISLYDDSATVAERCVELNAAVNKLSFPFAISLLGMGGDGHIASLFPDSDNLETGLQVDSTPRISMTMAALSRSDEIVLLFFGDAKREIYEKAKASSTAYPVSALLFQNRAPVHVFWAP